MTTNKQDNFCDNIEFDLSIETVLPNHIVGDNTVLITILDYRTFVSRLVNDFIEDNPDVNIIVDSFACGSNGNFRFIAKKADSKDFYHLVQSENKELVEFASGVLEKNAKYKNMWAVSEITLERILNITNGD